jgi:hypothetical protein
MLPLKNRFVSARWVSLYAGTDVNCLHVVFTARILVSFRNNVISVWKEGVPSCSRKDDVLDH